MRPLQVLYHSLRALLKNKVRTGLTMLGIIIGIASVIAMVAIGQGASTMIQDSINSMGRNLILVMPGAAQTGGFSFGAGTTQTLTPEDGNAILREVPVVRSVAPLVRAKGQLVYGSQNWTTSIQGTSLGFLDVRDWETSDGSFFTDADISSASKVCVLGATVAQNLFQGESPVQQVMRIKNMPFRVLGVLAKKGTNARGDDQDDTVIAPWTTVKRVLQGSAFLNVDQLLVTATTAGAIDEATQGIKQLLRQRHHLADKDEDDFQIRPMTEIANALATTTGTMTALLATIAAISLIVGGIGIMNIMLVSVVERTKEIGLRMAVGARGRDILVQFLTEAITLSVIAGLIGMALGVGAALLVAHAMHWPSLVSPQSMGLSFVFSCAVGVFFGFYPALRASRLDPIEALRYE